MNDIALDREPPPLRQASLLWAFLAALALHAAIGAALALLSCSPPADDPPLTIELVLEAPRAPAAEAAPQPEPAVEAAAPEPPKSVLQPAQRPRPARRPQPKSSALVKEPAKEEEGAALAPAAPSAPPASSPALPASAPAAPAVATPDPEYAAALLAWLNRFKEYPFQARRRRLQGKVVLLLVIARDGKVAEVRIETSSGTELLDRAALDMVAHADPLPAVPAALAAERVEFRVPVDYALAQP